MRILHSGNLASVGRNLCLGLRRKGVLADLVDSRYANRLGILEQGDEGWTYLVDAKRGMATALLDRIELIYGMRLTKGLELADYDMFHFHHVLNPINMGLAVRNMLADLRPVVLHFHGSVTSKSKTWNHRMRSFLLRRNCRTVLCSTPNILESIQDLTQNKRYLPNAIDVSAFKSVVCSDKLSQSVLCWVKLESAKGIKTIFQTARTLPKLEFHIPNTGLTGERELYQHRKPPNIRLIPSVPHSDVPKLICRYPIVLGQFKLGTIGVSELEAMACGKPLIGFWNTKYDVHYGEPCPILSSTDPKEISELIEEHIGDTSLGSRCRNWVERYHSIDVVVEKLLDAYAEAIES